MTDIGLDVSKLGTGGSRISSNARLVLPVYAVSIFLSAFLLFSVQPMFAKMVLPVLGGSPGVWSVAMVFFQSMLLAGYGYAHILTTRFSLKTAGIIHVLVLLSAFVFLPLALPTGWSAPPESGQAFWLLGLFGVAVGLPFFAVSANSPLLQAWFSRTGHEQADDPYFLYGASNIGSFASLLLYIVLFEPLMTVSTQSWTWAAGFAALTVLIGVCAMLALRSLSTPSRATTTNSASLKRTTSWKQPLQWIGLAAVPSGLLVAVTAHISTDIASAPFLWVIPLALFLLTFVLAFARNPIFNLNQLSVIVLILACATLYITLTATGHKTGIALPVHLVFFFFAALLAHSFLVKLRPAAEDLTAFYMWMSLGGVLGGAITTLVSPQIFSIVLEYPLLVLASIFCVPALYETSGKKLPGLFGLSFRIWIVLAVMVMLSFKLIKRAHDDNLFIERSFFGVVSVKQLENKDFVGMKHGTTLHGAMRRVPAGIRPTPTTYYHESGGIARSLFAKQEMLAGRSANMAVAGLGAGSILCHRKPGELWTSYEIDRAVVKAASDPSLFRFVSDCGQGDPIIVGDARLTLADEPNAKFDFMLLDAFSSDSIPTHLLTVEAFNLYSQKLARDGMLTVHISNRYMELESVLAAIARETGFVGRSGNFSASKEAQDKDLVAPSTVVVLAKSEAALGSIVNDPSWKPLKERGTTPWTDDYSNIPAAIYRYSTSKWAK